MNKIIVNRGTFKLNEVEFQQGTLTIGRAADNTITLDDNAVSGHHVKIITLFNTSYIEDLDSTNGTLVNGHKVTKRTLHSGDIISVGNHQLLYQSDASAKKVSETADTLMMAGGEVKERLNDFIRAHAEAEANVITSAQNSEPAAATPKPAAPVAVSAPKIESVASVAPIQGDKKTEAPKEARNNRITEWVLNDDDGNVAVKAAPTSEPKSEMANVATAIKPQPAEDKTAASSQETEVKTEKASLAGITTGIPAENKPLATENKATAASIPNTANKTQATENSAEQTKSTQTTSVDSKAPSGNVAKAKQSGEIKTPEASRTLNTAAKVKTTAGSTPIRNHSSFTEKVAAPRAKPNPKLQAAFNATSNNSRRATDPAFSTGGGTNVGFNPAHASESGNKSLLPLLWFLIVAVLVAEIVYITYRSFS
ncbi:FHA domain-containing protein [Kaarinaea lacus]